MSGTLPFTSCYSSSFFKSEHEQVSSIQFRRYIVQEKEKKKEENENINISVNLTHKNV